MKHGMDREKGCTTCGTIGNGDMTTTGEIGIGNNSSKDKTGEVVMMERWFS